MLVAVYVLAGVVAELVLALGVGRILAGRARRDTWPTYTPAIGPPRSNVVLVPPSDDELVP